MRGIVILLMALTLLLMPTAANAHSTAKSVTVTTDSMPTRVDFEVSPNRRVVTCVRVKTAPGHTRHVVVRNAGRVVMNTRVARNSYTGCLRSFVIKSRYARVTVTEDLPGPWNFVSRGTVRLR